MMNATVMWLLWNKTLRCYNLAVEDNLNWSTSLSTPCSSIVGSGGIDSTLRDYKFEEILSGVRYTDKTKSLPFATLDFPGGGFDVLAVETELD